MMLELVSNLSEVNLASVLVATVITAGVTVFLSVWCVCRTITVLIRGYPTPPLKKVEVPTQVLPLVKEVCHPSDPCDDECR